MLQRELKLLAARDVVFQVALREQDFRIDGEPRANAKPTHPGVILSFDCKYGPVQYPCDKFRDFESNVRAIALSLEALRKVDRYGVTKHGEQYTGWKAIGTGIAMGTGDAMTVEEAAAFIAGNCGDLNRVEEVEDDPSFALALYKDAARLLHPDVGGSTNDFQKLQDAKRILEEKFGALT